MVSGLQFSFQYYKNNKIIVISNDSNNKMSQTEQDHPVSNHNMQQQNH